MCREVFGFSPPVIYRMYCRHAEAGAKSKPARGEGVGMDKIHLDPFSVKTS
jgi:hypothetical protein